MLVSAGCGRTGVLCAVDYVRQLLLTQVRCHLLLCAACPTPAYQGLFTLILPLSVPDNPTQFQPLRCGPRDAETASCCSADRGVCVPRLPIPPAPLPRTRGGFCVFPTQRSLTPTGAVQVPVPHSGPAILPYSPEHQPPPPETKGGTGNPQFHSVSHQHSKHS